MIEKNDDVKKRDDDVKLKDRKVRTVMRNNDNKEINVTS